MTPPAAVVEAMASVALKEIDFTWPENPEYMQAAIKAALNAAAEAGWMLVNRALIESAAARLDNAIEGEDAVDAALAARLRSALGNGGSP